MLDRIQGGPRVHHAHRHQAPQAHSAVHSSGAASDRNQAEGLKRFNRAKTGELPNLPWQQQASSPKRGFQEALKTLFIAQAIPASKTHVLDVLARHQSQLSPDALQAIAKLDEAGKLDAVDHVGRSVINELDSYLSEPGANPKVAEALVKQLADPEGSIYQAKANTCAVAGPQKDLAMKSPARYFRVATHLLDKGKTYLSHIGPIHVGEKNLKAILAEDKPWNEKLNALVQTAFMQKANGHARYDYATDTSYGTTKDGDKDPFKGVKWAEARGFAEALLDAPVMSMNAMRGAVHKATKAGRPRAQVVAARLEARLAESKAEGHLGVFIPIRAEGAEKAHMVLVTSIENGQAQFLDGKKGTESSTLPLDYLAGRVTLTADIPIGNLRSRPSAPASSGEFVSYTPSYIYSR